VPTLVVTGDEGGHSTESRPTFFHDGFSRFTRGCVVDVDMCCVCASGPVCLHVRVGTLGGDELSADA
jgi:hypothetical protein